MINIRALSLTALIKIMILDSEEIQVIDDDLISAALRDADTHISKESSSEVSPTALADMVAEATCLSLSFKNILKIGNLQGFQALGKLCLDNNIIKSIDSLGHLVNLTWLDLSFNCITKINGLEQLERLSDLSLFNNLIDDIEGLESCRKLQCLSLGNNNITALDSIVKLRCFKNLQLLNLEGNPVSKEGEYRMYVLAYLNDLTYLDYSMVVRTETVAAREQYQDELLDVEEKEALEEEKAARENAATRHTSKLRAANLAVVETIFDDMFAEDTEMTKLKHLPGITDIINSFQSEVESASDLFLQTGLVKDQQKLHEIKLFETSVHNLRVQYASESVYMIETFERSKKRRLKELGSRQHIEHIDLEYLRLALGNLSNALMDLEMRQVEQFEDLMGEFETKFTEIKLSCLEGQQSYFRVVEEHENNYTRDLMQLVNELLEKAAKEELPGDIADEASSLLIDRDTCMNAITGSHDIHVGRLYKFEDEVKNNEETLCKHAIRKYRDDEHTRSRNRIVELKALEDACANELTDMVTREVDDDIDGDPE